MSGGHPIRRVADSLLKLLSQRAVSRPSTDGGFVCGSLQLPRRAPVDDLDRIETADRQSSLLGVNRADLYSVSEADHGERDGSRLRGEHCLQYRLGDQ
jgi:hypothetical protein